MEYTPSRRDAPASSPPPVQFSHNHQQPMMHTSIIVRNEPATAAIFVAGLLCGLWIATMRNEEPGAGHR